MRAARILHCLLLLQNRGRMTSVALARELEVSPRTILRDVDAMTEAGLPVIVHQGNKGGIELGFNYRIRLTGLTTEEADALGMILNLPLAELDAIGLGTAGRVALSKIREILPETIRARAQASGQMFSISSARRAPNDLRLVAMAEAVRGRNIVTLRAQADDREEIHPVHLQLGADAAAVVDRFRADAPIPLDRWGSINISARVFSP